MERIEAQIADLKIGGGNGIVVQTMCNTHTSDVEASVAQCKRLAKAGHHPILLCGGATGLIGDPRPTAEREMITKEKLAENFETLIGAIVKARPSAAKGQYIRSCTIASTMGPGIRINTSKLQ